MDPTLRACSDPMAEFLKDLPKKDIKNLKLVSRAANFCASQDTIWKELCYNDFPNVQKLKHASWLNTYQHQASGFLPTNVRQIKNIYNYSKLKIKDLRELKHSILSLSLVPVPRLLDYLSNVDGRVFLNDCFFLSIDAVPIFMLLATVVRIHDLDDMDKWTLTTGVGGLIIGTAFGTVWSGRPENRFQTCATKVLAASVTTLASPAIITFNVGRTLISSISDLSFKIFR